MANFVRALYTNDRWNERIEYFDTPFPLREIRHLPNVLQVVLNERKKIVSNLSLHRHVCCVLCVCLCVCDVCVCTKLTNSNNSHHVSRFLVQKSIPFSMYRVVLWRFLIHKYLHLVTFVELYSTHEQRYTYERILKSTTFSSDPPLVRNWSGSIREQFSKKWRYTEIYMLK